MFKRIIKFWNTLPEIVRIGITVFLAYLMVIFFVLSIREYRIGEVSESSENLISEISQEEIND
jgi:hypothetical protein